LWSSGETTQTLDVFASGDYILVVTTPFGCEDEFTTTIDEECPGTLYVPNSFTPNGDGVNDVWFVYGENILEFYVQIWDRWGEEIYASDNMYQPWQGQRRNGDQYVQNDVYTYKVTYRMRGEDGKLGEELFKKGHIVMVR
jgi:gliding motility-associated-like protein